MTLLDLDNGRFQGGWGRVRNALTQGNTIKPTFEEDAIDKLPAWNADRDFPRYRNEKGAVRALENRAG
ncbi:MAG: hypothetical protein L0G46_09615, partial [Kocuria sp.]|nr:hypothetical protein [Kocuria sp.]